MRIYDTNRNVFDSHGRRWSHSLPSTLLALVLALLMACGPLLRPAPVQAAPASSSCANAQHIVQDCTLRTVADGAIQQLEAEAINELLAAHQLPAADAALLLGWERNLVRAAVFNKLLGIIQDPGDGGSNGFKYALRDALARLVQQRRIEAAEAARAEYAKWAADACHYTPPPGFSYSAGCSPLGTILGAIHPPSFEEFQNYGASIAYAEFQNDQAMQQISGDMVRGIGGLAGIWGAVGAGLIGGLIGANLAASGVILGTLQPFLAMGTNFLTGAVSPGISIGGVSGATSIGGAAAIVILAVVISVFQGIAVFEDAEIPGKLDEAVASARNNLPNLQELIESEAGLREVYAAFLVSTMPDFPSTDPVPSGAPPWRFILNPHDGYQNFQLSDELRYRSWDDTLHSARLYNGWFVDRDAAGRERLTLDIDYLDDDGKGWTAWRVGMDFLSTRTGDGSTPVLNHSIRLQGWGDPASYPANMLSATIQPNTAPVITNAAITTPAAELKTGTLLQFQASAADHQADPVTISWDWGEPRGTVIRCTPTGDGTSVCTSVPAPLEIERLETGTAPTHTYRRAGTYTVTVYASDRKSPPVWTSFEVVVANVAPTVRAWYDSPDFFYDVGQSVPIKVVWDDPGFGDSHTITVDWKDGTPPATQQFAGSGSSSFNFFVRETVFTHTYQAPGYYEVAITIADDLGGSDTTMLLFQVEQPNTAPAAANDSATTAEDTSTTIAVLANDSDVDGDALTAQPVTNPGHGTLTPNANGTITYTPHANFNGADSFTYKANDSTADSNIATVNLTVTPVNDAPTAENDSATTAEDAATTINVLANDGDVEGQALTPVIVSQPEFGTVSVNGDKTLTYTPAANYNGADSFTYQASDGSLHSSAATVSLTITPANEATSTMLTSSANPSSPKSAVTFTAVVTVVAPGVGVPSGSVTFQDGTTVLGTVPLNNAGRASLTTAALALGAHTITAAYSGGGEYNPSASAPLPQAVHYNFGGFLQPVDHAPVVNVSAAGSAIPVKFSLSGDQGLNVFASGYPKSQIISCDGSVPSDDIEQTSTASTSGLQYDATSDTYIYTWKTEKSWRGACRQLTMRLQDGTEHVTNFRFK